MEDEISRRKLLTWSICAVPVISGVNHNFLRRELKSLFINHPDKVKDFSFEKLTNKDINKEKLQKAQLELRKIRREFEEGTKEHEWIVGHSRGFEAEETFKMVLRKYQDLKSHQLKEILARIYPEFVKDLFKIRSCVRDLKCVSCKKQAYDNCDCAPDKFFEIGKIYKSIDFNGGTYSIEGYEAGKKRIGSAYFEVVKDYTF